MPFCIRCSPNDLCGNSEGLISVNWDIRASFRTLDGDCATGSSGPVSPSAGGSTGIRDIDQVVPGPTVGSITIVAYAFAKGEDKWANSRCVGQAQASQSNIQKYDGAGDKHYIIPSRTNTAQITGDVGSFVSMNRVCTTTTVESKLFNGATITTEMETWLGHGLRYTGEPLGIEFPDLGSFEIFNQICYLTSFNLSVDFPNNPATVTYNFQYILNCLEDSGSSSSPIGPSIG